MTLPDGWESVEVSEISYLVTKGTTPTSVGFAYTSSGIRFVKAESLRNGKIRHDMCAAIDSNAHEALKRSHLIIGDVLFTIAGTLGRVATVEKRDIPANTNQAVAIIRPIAGVNSSYLSRFLELAAREIVTSEGRGTGLQNLNLAQVAAIQFPLPPETEQRRIVAKLDALTARLARVRAELDRVPVLAANLRTAAATEAFQGSATARFREISSSAAPDNDQLSNAYEAATGHARRKPVEPISWQPDFSIPASWRWVSVDHAIAMAQYGSSAKTSDEPGIPVLRMGNLQNGKLDCNNLKYLPPEHGEFPELFLQPGDVLFNRTNSFELVGKSAVFLGSDQPTSFASYLIRVRCYAIRPKLLVYYLNSAVGRQWVSGVASQQVGQANVNGTKLKGLGIPLPPEDEQAEMEAWIDSAFARADRLEAEAARARALIDRLESAILAKAFRGELVPQDPNDESASVLLDRIRAERAAAPKAKRGRAARASA